MSWLAYANLMLGQYDRAEENLGSALAAVERNPGATRVLGGYLLMRGRHMIETDQWEDVTLDTPESVEGSNAYWVSVVGMSAAHRGDMETAFAAIDRLEVLQKQATADGKIYDAKVVTILGKEVMAVTSLFSGDTQRAIEIAREAAKMEMREMNAPSGPPMPMKPAVELYGDFLLAADRPVEALVAYERSMQWIPQRTPSILGLANAANAAGDNETADEMFTKVKEMPGAKPAIR